MILRPLILTLFPYTTLFRSLWDQVKYLAADLRVSKKYAPVLIWNSPPSHSLRVFFRHRSEEHTSELQSRVDLVCRLLLEKKKDVPPELLSDDADRRRLVDHS